MGIPISFGDGLQDERETLMRAGDEAAPGGLVGEGR